MDDGYLASAESILNTSMKSAGRLLIDVTALDFHVATLYLRVKLPHPFRTPPNFLHQFT